MEVETIPSRVHHGQRAHFLNLFPNGPILPPNGASAGVPAYMARFNTSKCGEICRALSLMPSAPSFSPSSPLLLRVAWESSPTLSLPPRRPSPPPLLSSFLVQPPPCPVPPPPAQIPPKFRSSLPYYPPQNRTGGFRPDTRRIRIIDAATRRRDDSESPLPVKNFSRGKGSYRSFFCCRWHPLFYSPPLQSSAISVEKISARVGV